MGNVFKNSNKSKEECLQDIENTNKITNNDLFFKKTLRRLNFSLHRNFFTSLFTNKVIYCELVFFN
jgi:hypothetical protein